MLPSQRNGKQGKRRIRIHDVEQGAPTLGITDYHDSPERLPLPELGMEMRPVSRAYPGRTSTSVTLVGEPELGYPTDKPSFKKMKESQGPPVKVPPELEENEIFSKDAISSATGRAINYDRIRTAAIWKTYMKDAEREDKEAMELWMNNMDTLLVFAGLFSAILTAFLVLSSADLKPDPLDTISSQLTKLTLVVASGAAPDTSTSDSFVPSQRAVRVNFVWFISLSFAILAAAGAMLAKSWCLEYSRQSSAGSPFEQAQRRQRRYTGLQQWKFQEIVDLLPGLLYLAIILFMIGICDYLVDFHLALAITTSAIFACGLAFIIFSIAASVMYENCPFRIPLLEAAKKLLLNPYTKPQAPGQTFNEAKQEMADQPAPMSIKYILQRARWIAVQRIWEPALDWSSETLSSASQPLVRLSALVSYNVSNIFLWIWSGHYRHREVGTDFVEEPIDPDDQTVVDSVGWIIQSSPEPAVVSVALSMIPDILRTPRHHLDLVHAGAGRELIRRCSELSQFKNAWPDGEVIRDGQLVGLAQLLHFLLRPLDQEALGSVVHDPNLLFRFYGVLSDLESSTDPDARALDGAFQKLIRRRTSIVVDDDFDPVRSRSSTIRSLCILRASLRPADEPGHLARMNTLLTQFWESQTPNDFEVNYAYISALTSYLGYDRISQRPAGPSYTSCIYYCVENLTRQWVTTTDPDLIRAAGITAAITAREVGRVFLFGSQLGRSFQRFMQVMSTSWNNCLADRLAALRRAEHYRIPVDASDQLISHTLRVCSNLLGNPESDPDLWKASSELELKPVLSFLGDLHLIVTNHRRSLTNLLRYRYLLAQFMGVLRSEDLAVKPGRQSISNFIRHLLRQADSTTLLEHLVVAGFPHIMARLLKPRLNARLEQGESIMKQLVLSSRGVTPAYR